MRKSIILLLPVLLLLTACNLPRTTPTPAAEAVATSVARTLTAQPTVSATATTAAPHSATPSAASATATVTPTVTLTATPIPEDPKASLGDPTWKNKLDNGKSFGLDAEGYDDGNTRFVVSNGAMVITSYSANGYRGWRLAPSLPQNFYLEGTFKTQNCAGNDQYGLVFKAPDYNDGRGYYFGITCDGRYFLTRWDNNGTTNVLEPVESKEIHAGAGQTNYFGVWAQGNRIMLYANGKLLKEVSESALNGDKFGVFISGYAVPGFTVELDEIAYWNLP